MTLANDIEDFESAGTLDATRDVVDWVMSGLRPAGGTDGYKLSSSVLDTSTPDASPPPILSIEIVVTTEGGRHVAFIDHLLRIFDDLMASYWRRGVKAKFAGGMSLRFTRPTAAYLGMQYPTSTSSEERFCHIEIIAAREQWVTGRPLWGPGSDYSQNDMENYTEVFTDAFERATAQFGARLHWGQLTRTGSFDWSRYPEYDKLLEVRTALTQQGHIQTFDNDFVRHYLPVWENMGGHGIDIAIGGHDATFVIGTDTPAPHNGGIWEFHGEGWASQGGHGVRIAVDPDGRAWIVNSRHENRGSRRPEARCCQGYRHRCRRNRLGHRDG